MSSENGDSGKDRATVALAVEKIEGLKALTELGFSQVHHRLDVLDGLPVEVADLKARVRMLEAQRVHWPSFIPAILAVAIAALALFL